MSKNAKQIERHFKGLANHWRVKILEYVATHPGTTLDELWKALRGNEKTVSEHTRKLVYAGLLDKTYKGRTVLHTLSPYGETFHAFMKTL